MRNIWIVMRKELARVFKDKKLIITTMILPGLLIFLVYTLIGNAFGGMLKPDPAYTIYETGLVEEIKTDVVDTALQMEIEITFEAVLPADIEAVIEEVKEGEKPLYIYYNDAEKQLITYFNGEDISSANLASIFDAVLKQDTYTKTMINGEEISLITMQVSKSGNGFNPIAMILPMLIITFLFQGALAVGPESIAGDKERGTIATLLATPTKRSQIAFGKIFSLSILSILSSLSSFIGVMLSLPKLMQLEGGANISFGFDTYLYVLIILLSSVLVVISLISVTSAFAKNVKEASTLAAPIMLISIGVGMSTMFTQKGSQNIALYLIPIFNTANLLKDAFAGNINYLFLGVATLANLVVAGGFIYLLTRMFNSEKRMFTK